MRKLVLILAGLGAAKYFFDRKSGPSRRSQALDRALTFVRKAKRLPQPNDATLAHKVETEIFRDPDVPKGQINVNAEGGVVVLRGEVERRELIQDLEERTRNVNGVKEVENLLHLTGTEAPMHSVR